MCGGSIPPSGMMLMDSWINLKTRANQSLVDPATRLYVGLQLAVVSVNKFFQEQTITIRLLGLLIASAYLPNNTLQTIGKSDSFGSLPLSFQKKDSFLSYGKTPMMTVELGPVNMSPTWSSSKNVMADPRSASKSNIRSNLNLNSDSSLSSAPAWDDNVVMTTVSSVCGSKLTNYFVYTWAWSGIFFCCLLAVITLFKKLLPSVSSKVGSKLAALGTEVSAFLRNQAFSPYEPRLVIGVSIASFILGATIATSSDDIVDSALLIVLSFVLFSLMLASILLAIQFFYALSAVSSGEAWRKVGSSDLCNVVLCLTRIVLCWARYLIYDIQVDSVDLALHYTDDMFTSDSMPTYLKVWGTTLDIFFALLQTLLSLFKIGIASFLVWLILDLFVLRPVSLVLTKWNNFKRS